MALKTSWETPAGSGSADTEKSWYWPGAMAPPAQVTSSTAVVKVPSSVVSGCASVTVCTVMVQPGTDLTRNWAIG